MKRDASCQTIKGYEQPVFRQAVKRGFDRVLAVLALVLLAPLLLVLAVLVRRQFGNPVLFRQVRPGRDGKPFRLYKFRTMTDERDENGELRPDTVRLTPFGVFLRRASLDELPELINVLRGEMSLVGPRPLLIRYLPYFSKTEQLRHTVLPGITGWAQINGRNFLPWDQRLAMDVWYVRNWSLTLDMKILFRTIVLVLKRDGVSADANQVESDLDQERMAKGVSPRSC